MFFLAIPLRVSARPNLITMANASEPEFRSGDAGFQSGAGGALPDFNTLDDVELVSIARTDEDHHERELAYRTLVDRYRQRIHALCYRMLRDADDAEEAAQETFVKAFTKLHYFRGESQFYSWLYRIALNTLNDYYDARKLRRRLASADVAVVEPMHTGDPNRPDRAAEREDMRHIARRAIEKIPPVFRAVLVLREYEGMEYREIAEVLGISVGTVMSRMFRARARFKALMERFVPSLKSGEDEASE